MTRLDKPVRREVEIPYGLGKLALVVEINRGGVRVREKGRRTWFPVKTWGQEYREGAERAALERRKLKPKRASRRKLGVGV